MHILKKFGEFTIKRPGQVPSYRCLRLAASKVTNDVIIWGFFGFTRGPLGYCFSAYHFFFFYLFVLSLEDLSYVYLDFKTHILKIILITKQENLTVTMILTSTILEA